MEIFTSSPPDKSEVELANTNLNSPSCSTSNTLHHEAVKVGDCLTMSTRPSASDMINSASVNLFDTTSEQGRSVNTLAGGEQNPPRDSLCPIEAGFNVIEDTRDLNVVEEIRDHTEAGCNVVEEIRDPMETGENVVNENDGEDEALSDADDIPVPEPAVGMVFQTLDEVKEFYKNYGFSKGFGVIAQRGSNNLKTGQRRHSTFTCECFGNPNQKYISNLKKQAKNMAGCNIEPKELRNPKRRGSKKCLCTAMLHVSRNEVDHWVITKVVLEHKNHDPKPSDAKLVKEFRMKSFNSTVDKKVINDYNAGVPQSKTRNSMALERGGFQNMPFTMTDMRHRVNEHRKLKMQGGDAKALVAYFDKMQKENVNFLHAHRLDEEAKLKDIVWVDARSRAAYKEFSDVVCFDTTYLTNLYALPFANFVGVNHHGQSILLGCALISNEDCDTFRWVFSKWLMFMEGKQPGGILTDQAAAFRKPLEEVMPDTKHRWCIWHIMMKLPHKFGTHDRYASLKEDLLDIVYNSLNEQTFMNRWGQFLIDYGLEEDEWLAHLFSERHMWVPAFMTDHFWAGMRSTQRVESIHSFFDQFVSRETLLCEFGERYTLAVDKRISDEKEADELGWKIIPPLKDTGYSFEKFFHKIYTPNKFRELQRECERVSHSSIEERKEIDSCTTVYWMEDRVWHLSNSSSEPFITEDRTMYSVEFKSDTSLAFCDCKMFETNGIVCRHIIRVLDKRLVKKPPDFYILRRWRKDVVREHMSVKVLCHDLKRGAEVARRDRVLFRIDRIADLSEKSEARTKIVLKGLDKIEEDVKAQAVREAKKSEKAAGTSEADSDRAATEATVVIGSSQTGVATLSSPGPQSQCSDFNDACLDSSRDEVANEVIIKDPKIPKKRGRPRTTRYKSAMEIGYKNLKKCNVSKKLSEEGKPADPKTTKKRKAGQLKDKKKDKKKAESDKKKGKSKSKVRPKGNCVGKANGSLRVRLVEKVKSKSKNISTSSGRLREKAKTKSVTEILQGSSNATSQGTQPSNKTVKRRKTVSFVHD